jgi:hypothetical protein
MKGFSENLKVHHKNKGEEGNRKKKRVHACQIRDN